jgi:hypothetical protein
LIILIFLKISDLFLEKTSRLKESFTYFSQAIKSTIMVRMPINDASFPCFPVMLTVFTLFMLVAQGGKQIRGAVKDTKGTGSGVTVT